MSRLRREMQLCKLWSQCFMLRNGLQLITDRKKNTRHQSDRLHCEANIPCTVKTLKQKSILLDEKKRKPWDIGKTEMSASWNQWSMWVCVRVCVSSTHSPRPYLSHVTTKRPGICLMTRDVHTAHQWTHHLMVAGCQFPELISLAAFLPSDSVIGGERSGEAEDHELSFSQEWRGERKERWRRIKKGEEKRETNWNILCFCLKGNKNKEWRGWRE